MVINMKGMCGKCKKRKTCKKLCKKAEVYVSQDHVSQQEYIGCFPADDNITEIAGWDDVNLENPTILKGIILKLYFEDKRTVMDISKMVPCVHSYISKVIGEYSKSRH